MKKIISILVLGSLVLGVFSFIFKSNEVRAQATYSSSECLSLQYNMKYGARDYNTRGEVSKLQMFLNNAGYLQSGPTGYFGLATRAAVIAYQTDNGLYNIGYVGTLTRLAIYNDTCNVNPNPVPVPTPTPTPVQTYFCSINNQIYYSVMDYNNNCKSQTNNYYCQLNSQTYYSVNDYNNYCKSNTINYCSLDIQYTGGGYAGARPCICPSGSTEVSLGWNGDMYNYKCTSNNISNNFCPTNGIFYDYSYLNCSCQNNTVKTLAGPSMYQCSGMGLNNYCPLSRDFSFTEAPSCVCPSGFTKTFVNGTYDSYFCQNNSNPMSYKPVIYLYPTKTEDVSVKLDYDGQIFVSYPNYNEGWNVKVSPNSTIINLADNQEYSYLFWEGNPNTKIDYDMTKGFLVEGEDTVKFLQEKLKSIGLIPKEYNEFIVYWYPKMKDNKYNIIHFASKEEYDDHAKLNITPTPESILRVFMVYQATNDENLKLVPQTFNKFKRNGFSVVEWGGTELK